LKVKIVSADEEGEVETLQRFTEASRPLIAMDQALRQRLVGVWIGVAAVVVASFLPWGTFVAKPTVSIEGFPGGGFPGNPFGEMTMKVTLTGWTGTMTLLGMSVPNWFNVVLAVAAAAVATLGATGAWNPPRLLVVVLACLGLAQVAGTLLVLLSATGASLGVGILVALASFIGLVRACSQVSRREQAPA
jgi:hypothetical protein